MITAPTPVLATRLLPLDGRQELQTIRR